MTLAVFSSASEIECRSKTAFLLADMKAEYDGQIPSEVIEFARVAALRMCLAVNNNAIVIEQGDSNERISRISEKPKKKPFLGITFGDSERKDGNKRLLNRK